MWEIAGSQATVITRKSQSGEVLVEPEEGKGKVSKASNSCLRILC